MEIEARRQLAQGSQFRRNGLRQLVEAKGEPRFDRQFAELRPNINNGLRFSLAPKTGQKMSLEARTVSMTSRSYCEDNSSWSSLSKRRIRSEWTQKAKDGAGKKQKKQQAANEKCAGSFLVFW